MFNRKVLYFIHIFLSKYFILLKIIKNFILIPIRDQRVDNIFKSGIILAQEEIQIKQLQ